MNQMKSYTSTSKYNTNLGSINSLKRKDRISRNQLQNSAMSATTRDFIQKICYRKTASIDMTQYGFINDSKLHPVNLLMKPLKAQLEKICGKPSRNASVRRNTPVRKKVTTSLQATTPTPRSPCSPNTAFSRTPISPQSSPTGPQSSRTRVRKVTIFEPTPITRKKVTLVLPAKKKKRKSDTLKLIN